MSPAVRKFWFLYRVSWVSRPVQRHWLTYHLVGEEIFLVSRLSAQVSVFSVLIILSEKLSENPDINSSTMTWLAWLHETRLGSRCFSVHKWLLFLSAAKIFLDLTVCTIHPSVYSEVLYFPLNHHPRLQESFWIRANLIPRDPWGKYQLFAQTQNRGNWGKVLADKVENFPKGSGSSLIYFSKHITLNVRVYFCQNIIICCTESVNLLVVGVVTELIMSEEGFV